MSGSIVRTLEHLQATPIADGIRNSSIACDEQLFIYTSVPDEIEWLQQNLTTLCSATCTTSMRTWQSSVDSACSGQAMRHAGQIMEPKMLPMIYNYGQELVCLKSRYNLVLRLAFGMVADTGVAQINGASWKIKNGRVKISESIRQTTVRRETHSMTETNASKMAFCKLSSNPKTKDSQISTRKKWYVGPHVTFMTYTDKCYKDLQ